ncbi:MAG: M18 family aminopeptidase [Lachnospiraceae bacterium]|nr:M18 family aminopeptidase [Lachnospiraceae bacterium]
MSKVKKENNTAGDLIEFIWNSPSAFHVVDNIKTKLLQQDFQELKEREVWKIEGGKGYFVVRNDSSVIAFRTPKKEAKGFHVIASHSDAPTFKVKEKPELVAEEHYIRLNTEKYGGMIQSSWLDRPLSVAGRVFIREDGQKPIAKLVNVDKDLLVIPNLAIHMNHDINKGYEYNPQVDLLPLMALGNKETANDLLLQTVAEAAKVKKEDILTGDLFLYVREKGRLTGVQEEFVLSPRLDDLQCVHAALEAFAKAKPHQYINVMAVFDNEEVGSTTAQGADSTFWKDTLERIGESLGWNTQEKCCKLAESFLISADNAHAVHPNHPEKADPANRPYLGGGLVIKYHSGQKYTTDGMSAACMKLWCEAAKVPYQTFYNRSDMVGGFTLGNISNAQVSMTSVDVGLPQLAMHSAMEMAAGADSVAAMKVFERFYGE